MTIEVEVRRVSRGCFDVIVEGKKTMVIQNGNMGMTGKGCNIYGVMILNTTKVYWCGSLQKAKQKAALLAQAERKQPTTEARQ